MLQTPQITEVQLLELMQAMIVLHIVSRGASGIVGQVEFSHRLTKTQKETQKKTDFLKMAGFS